MTAQDLLLNLQAAGLDAQQTQHFLLVRQTGKMDAQLALLSGQRERLLAGVHRLEHQIDCLDYLVYRIQKDWKNG